MSKKEIKFPKRPATAALPEAADKWVSAEQGRGEPAPLTPEPVAAEVKLKRLTLDIPADLHSRIKSQCAKRSTKMVEEITQLLENHFPPEN